MPLDCLMKLCKVNSEKHSKIGLYKRQKMSARKYHIYRRKLMTQSAPEIIKMKWRQLQLLMRY